VSRRNRTRTQAYLEYKAKLEAILYDHDPYGFGSSIGAPSDEYSDEAARLAALLSHATHEGLQPELGTLFPESASLQAALFQATVDFRRSD